MLSKEKTYLVLNYDGSPVAVSTRYDSYLIAKGSNEEPSSVPLSVDEILQINSNSPVFKIGLLWFEDEFKQELYEECRIRNWETILTNHDIENIILNPTLEGLEKLLSIENEQYFERCYGVYIGLKNSNHSIRQNVESIMLARRKELRNRKHKTGILLSKKDTENVITEEAFEAAKMQNAQLANEVNELKAMVAKLLSSRQGEAHPSEDTKKPEPVKAQSAKATRGRPKQKT